MNPALLELYNSFSDSEISPLSSSHWLTLFTPQKIYYVQRSSCYHSCGQKNLSILLPPGILDIILPSLPPISGLNTWNYLDRRLWSFIRSLLLLYFLIDLISQSSFRFIEKLSSSYRGFPYICFPHTVLPSPTISFHACTERGLQSMNLHRHVIIIQSSFYIFFYIRVHSWCCTFYRFRQMYNDIYPPL